MRVFYWLTGNSLSWAFLQESMQGSSTLVLPKCLCEVWQRFFKMPFQRPFLFFSFFFILFPVSGTNGKDNQKESKCQTESEIEAKQWRAGPRLSWCRCCFVDAAWCFHHRQSSAFGTPTAVQRTFVILSGHEANRRIGRGTTNEWRPKGCGRRERDEEKWPRYVSYAEGGDEFKIKQHIHPQDSKRYLFNAANTGCRRRASLGKDPQGKSSGHTHL